jgi:hypothetical protein
VYGLKADFRWPAVGEGMSWVAVAMLDLAGLCEARCAGTAPRIRPLRAGWGAVGRETGGLSRRRPAVFDVGEAEQRVAGRWQANHEGRGAARRRGRWVSGGSAGDYIRRKGRGGGE